MTPEEALALAKAVADLYGKATADLLALIARRTATGMDQPDWAEQRLAQILVLRRDAQRIIGHLQTAGPAEAARLIREVYDAQGAPAGLVGVNNRTVVALASDLAGRLGTLGPPVLRTVEDIYRTVIAETLATAAAGGQTRQAAAAQALDRFAKAGIGGFTDSAGRRWSIDSYADMASRTALGRAHLAGTLDQYQAAGVDYVVVSNSPEECPQCRPFEGKVLSLGADVPPPDLAPGLEYAGTLAAATSAGLFHPSCTHRIHRYVAGLSRPIEAETENPDGYELRQRQRELERRVRESKRRVAAGRPYGDTPTLRRQEALLRQRRLNLDDFNNTHDRKDWVSRRRTQIPGGLPPKPRTPPAGRISAGDPISTAISVPIGTRAFKDRVQAGLDAIDQLHTDGPLPLIELRSSTSTQALGFYTPGSPGIRVRGDGAWPALTAVHEIGHFLDHKGIGNPRILTTRMAPIPDPMLAVIAAARRSDLFRILDGYDLTQVRPTLRREIVEHIAYLQSPPEVWARAYAQWVAVRSGSPVLLEELEAALAAGRVSGLVRQWEADDFKPVGEMIDELMRSLGWV